MSNLFKVNTQDLVHSLVNAVVAGVVLALAGIVGQSGFDVFTVDWASVAHVALNAAVAAFVGSLGKKLLTDSEGTVHLGFGRIQK